MRPAILFPLFAETRTLSGVGPKLEKLIARATGTRLVDLIIDLPVGIIDRSYRPTLKDAQEGRIATVEVTVQNHLPSRDPRRPYKVRCADETAFIELVFFRAKGDYLTRLLPVGARRIVSGRIERFRDGLQMVHPDHIVGPEDIEEFTLIEPVYRLTEGLPLKSLSKAVRGALEAVPELPEWLDKPLLRARGWSSFRDAVT
jgi:ATP-dependent DNA helicase RecG